ncbi:tRNA-splicing endonuclease subunit Sen2 [Chytriomyces hyalinus]|nr:tRNA-splicing endonuclease subunit Sen2 [Chytriomyces hyalinus]
MLTATLFSSHVALKGPRDQLLALWLNGCYGRGDGDDLRAKRDTPRHQAANTTSNTINAPTSSTTNAFYPEKETQSERILSLVETAHLLMDRLLVPVHSLVGQSWIVDFHPQGSSNSNGQAMLSAIVQKCVMLNGSVSAFAARLAVYRLFRMKGWVVRDGVRFAAEYVLYKPGGPLKYHADYAVHVHMVGRHSPESWKQILATIRFTEQAKKKMLHVSVSVPQLKANGNEGSLDQDFVTSLDSSNASIHMLQVSRWVP